MSITDFMTGHIKSILFFVFVLCLAGLLLLYSFPVGILPNVSFPRLTIIADAGERPAEMVVIDITRPLEESIATVRGVQTIRSKTARGATDITVNFVWGTDMVSAQQLVNTRISEVRSRLPADTNIQVQQMNPTLFPIVGLSLYSKGIPQTELWDMATYQIRPLLSRVPGVGQVVIQGGRIPEIAVEVDPVRMTAYGLSLADVEQALAQTNTITSVGRVDRQFQQYQILVSGQVTSPEALANTVVAQKNSIPIYLSQIATVGPSVQDPTTIVTADGRQSVLINIVRQPDANTISVAQGVQQEMARLKTQLPPGIIVRTFYDQSVLVRDSVGSVRDAVIIGIILSVIVLFFFLRDMRATVLTAVVIPITLLITFVFMRLAGLTLNLMTLGALAVAIGLIIDDAIVVVENIYRHTNAGLSPGEAVRLSVAEILSPMIASTLTTSVVFLPLLLLSGVTGVFFRELAITMVIALVVSLLLALFVNPGLAARILHVRREEQRQASLGRVTDRYCQVIDFGLRHRRMLLLLIPLIVVITVLVGMRLKTGFMPSMDEGAFVLDYLTPPGTSLSESNRMLNQIERILRETPEVSTFSRRTGTELGFAITEPNVGDFAVTLKAHRSRDIETVMDSIRNRILAEVPGVSVDFIQVLQDLIGDLAGTPAPVEVKLYAEDQRLLQTLSIRIQDHLGRVPGVVDVASSLVESGPELVVHIDQTRAGRVGMTAESVAMQANAAMFGNVATTYIENDRQQSVRVRYPRAWRADRAQVAALPIRTPGGSTVRLSTLGTIETVPGTTEINREDQRRYASITARLAGRDLGSVMRDVQRMMQRETLPSGVTYTFGGQFQSQSESFRGLLVVLILGVLLVFGVMLFLFEFFTAPLVILLVMPLSLFGVVMGLWVTGTPFNVSSFMGAIMLVGIVGENGILLLDRAWKGEQEGLSVEEAAAQAGEVRLRPILMTTLTAILALTPLALGIGAGAEMQKPLAIAVIGGLAFSTIFTLLFAPLIYVSFRRRQMRQTPRG